MAEEKTSELFALYAQTHDVEIRNKIAEKYLYIAEVYAKRFVGRGVEYDDLYQTAAGALLLGIERFDPGKGVKFSTFITKTIEGTIKNYFRDHSRLLKVPRKISEQNMAIRKFSTQYEVEHGEKPSVKAIAKALGFPEEDVVLALEVGGTVSLDGMTATESDESRSLYDLLPAGKDSFEDFELQETIRSELAKFPEKEREVIRLLYFENKSQTEAAKILGMSQMHVSRLARKTLAILYDRLKNSV
ncbi:MAG: sigma-70 family RNA polymerase sigma factor [Clostridia bacterium]|nr:sigma-70 family RNA polymerase sigma factor [Clostridia bacterium]